MRTAEPVDASAAAPRGHWHEVLAVFLRLGLTSFGGPVAHLGYFRDEFVLRRRWLDDHAYADLVALCQFLPGPASSQVGIAIGLSRAGYAGALAAWTGFTLPSAIALVLFAYGVSALGDVSHAGWLHGLKVVAVAVVAQAVLGMMRSLTPDRERATMAVLAAMVALALPTAWGQVVPGPLFTFAAYLGAVMVPRPNGWIGAALCLVAVFLPSFLLVVGALPFWQAIRRRAVAQAALRGVNAAVVGLLLAALYHPVWTAGISDAADFALAAGAFLLLFMWQTPPWLVVVLCAAGSALVAIV